MRDYIFTLKVTVRGNEISQCLRRLDRFLQSIPFPKGIKFELTNEAYWPSGGKIQETIMESSRKKASR